MLRITPIAALCCAVSPLFCATSAAWAEEKPARKTPIILDTDIGGEIDDALALGLVLTSPELDLRGVTTVYGDAYTRALIVCRLLDVLERGKIPVAAGAPPRQVPDFTGQMQYGLRPAHKRPVKEPAVEFLAAQLKAAPGELTIVCIGPLTNIAALLEKHPDAAKQIKRLVIMGGSIRVGYSGRPPADQEWNILADKKAAQRVLESGVPITLVPLDVTATLKLDGASLQCLFDAPMTLAQHLRGLHELRETSYPVILFDPTAVAVCIDESLCGYEERHIKVDDGAMTQVGTGRPNAKVATSVRRSELQKAFLGRITRPVLTSRDMSPKPAINVSEYGEFFVRGNRLDADALASIFADGVKSKLPFESLTLNIHPYAVLGLGQRPARAAAPLEKVKVVHNLLSLHDPVRGKTIPQGSFPLYVHVAEDYETNIERPWWLAGKLETDNVPEGSRRACRAVLTNDFDDLQGDKYAVYKGVIFNPVPGPPMGSATQLSFRYYLGGIGSLRIQIYSLTKGYHRQLILQGLPQRSWTEATVDMTEARRPDGSGGPLSKDERIDDIQFYADPRAELLIDDIVLYDASDEAGVHGAKMAKEKRPFPKQIVFTGWFDTGKQGAEWPGDFEIVPHKPPLTWKAAKAVAAPDSKSLWIRVDLRGARPLPAEARLRFRYFVRGAKSIGIELGAEGVDRRGATTLTEVKEGAWTETDIDLGPAVRSLLAGRKAKRSETMATMAREIVFRATAGAELLVDDVLLYEPGSDKPAEAKSAPK